MEQMKVEQNFTIRGKVVVLVSEFGGLKVYSEEREDSRTLFFVKNSDVIKRLIISADCGQNVGYISQCEFINP